jgi:hypothetical protein
MIHVFFQKKKQVVSAFNDLKLSDSDNNLITIRTSMGAIYLDKVSKIDQEKFFKNLEDNKYYILKIFKEEDSKIVLISTNSKYKVNDEIKPCAPCDKFFIFEDKKDVKYEKIMSETFD